MHFQFQLVTPPDRHDGYHPSAYTEGVLSLLDGDVCAWKSNDILLVEFASTVRKWLQRVQMDGPHTLHYLSMNYEEDPVLAFVWHPAARTYSVDSNLADADLSEVQHHELVAACQRFLNELSDALQTTCGLSLGAVLDRGER